MRRDARQAQIAALVAPQLGATEELLGTCTVWAARLNRVPLLFRGRHRYPLALTDARVLLFDRPRRRQQPDPLLALRFSRLEVLGSRRRIRLYQLVLGAEQDRRFVVEFLPRDRAHAHELEAQIASAREDAPR
jgi:hypothetical protein